MRKLLLWALTSLLFTSVGWAQTSDHVTVTLPGKAAPRVIAAVSAAGYPIVNASDYLVTTGAAPHDDADMRLQVTMVPVGDSTVVTFRATHSGGEWPVTSVPRGRMKELWARLTALAGNL